MFRSTFFHLFPRFRRPTGGKGPRASLRLEGLETRANPVSATLDAAGTLFVDGSGSVGSPINDRILLRQSNGFILVFDARTGVALTVPIQVAGTFVPRVPVTAVTGIDVAGLDGNDFIDLNSSAAGFAPITINATIRGGSGVDSIAGGAGNDVIFGGDNNDLIFGNEGDDSIMGGTGNDLIFGGAGDDTISGGADNDRLFGNDGSD